MVPGWSRCCRTLSSSSKAQPCRVQQVILNSFKIDMENVSILIFENEINFKWSQFDPGWSRCSWAIPAKNIKNDALPWLDFFFLARTSIPSILIPFYLELLLFTLNNVILDQNDAIFWNVDASSQVQNCNLHPQLLLQNKPFSAFPLMMVLNYSRAGDITVDVIMCKTCRSQWPQLGNNQ